MGWQMWRSVTGVARAWGLIRATLAWCQVHMHAKSAQLSSAQHHAQPFKAVAARMCCHVAVLSWLRAHLVTVLDFVSFSALANLLHLICAGSVTLT